MALTGKVVEAKTAFDEHSASLALQKATLHAYDAEISPLTADIDATLARLNDAEMEGKRIDHALVVRCMGCGVL